ncbi:calcium-binding protein [Microvirga terricola]|uniref:Calcium-binding protein n=1 Tax=Microvirga terricola TaxID=2719797 RepID=A0ABX0V888_9HYPH|nr:calcium-binding protein [Microvirga terricola]NIX76034.1 calcium-binding protein [Microvirga terricola]
MTAPAFWNSEFTVNSTTTNDQNEPVVTALADGRFVVTWTDWSQGEGDTTVRAQMYNADGSKKSNEFVVHSTTTNNQHQPSVTALSNGNFVVVWADDRLSTEANPNVEVYGRVFNVDGVPVGNEFLVPMQMGGGSTNGNQMLPSVCAISGTAGFAVSWHDDNPHGTDSSGSSIRTIMYNGDGTPRTGEIQVNVKAQDDQTSPAMADLGNQKFVVVWTDQTGDADQSAAIKMRIVNSDGTFATGENRVNTEVGGDQMNAKVTRLANGGFVVTWQSGELNDYEIAARVYDASGAPIGGEFAVNSSTFDKQIEPTVTALNDGRFMVTWSDNSEFVESDYEVKGQIFALSGGHYAKDGGEFRVTTGGIHNQQKSSVTTLVDGRVVVAWWSDNGDSSSGAVHARILEPREAGIELPGTALNDDYIGTAFNDTLHGAGGNDKLDGAGGNDILDGGAGADALIGGAGFDYADYRSSTSWGVNVNLQEGGGEYGDAAGDVYVGIEGAYGSAFGDSFIGNGAANHFLGGDGDDYFTASAGADTMDGGRGMDTVDYWGATSSVIISLMPGAVQGGFAAGQVLIDIEKVFGSAFNDTMSGNDEVNYLIGNAGDDSLSGLGGDDYLAGEAGNDTLLGGSGADLLIGQEGNDLLEGGSGADTLRGDDGIDMASYAHSSEAVVVSLADPSINQGVDAIGDRYLGIEGLIGSAFNDWLIGDAGNNILEGGAGADTLDGGDGFDIVSYARSSSAVRMDLGGIGLSTGDAVGDVLISIEGVEGSQFDDVLIAGSSGSYFLGGGGNDWMQAGGGADNLNGGDGFDTVTWATASGRVVVNLSNQAANGGAALGDVVTGVEAFYLTAYGDHFTANPATSVTVYGMAGNDVIIGSAQADYLDGGSGSDVLQGGGGNDTYLVDVASDVVVELAGGGYDTVYASTNYVLGSRMEVEVLCAAGGSASISLTGSETNNTIIGNDGANRLEGKGARDVIRGGAGNDRIDGGLHSDTLDGGAGRDIFVFSTKIDKKKTNVDKIVKFNVKDDSIHLENAIFKALGKGSVKKPVKLKADMFTIGKAATDENDRIIYDKKTGALYYDADGSGSGAALMFAQLDKNLKLTAADFFVI